MSNQELLSASEKGDLKSVRQILKSNKVDINYQDVSIQ